MGRRERWSVDNIKRDLGEVGWDGIDGIELAQSFRNRIYISDLRVCIYIYVCVCVCV